MKKTLLTILTIGINYFGFAQKAPPSLPINWNDTATVDYTVIDFGGDSSLLASDPINSNNVVLKSIKTAGSQTWAGTVIGNDSLANPVPFSVGNTQLRVAVYSPTANIPVRIKVEDETNAAISVETEAMTTVANAWDTLTFDFSNNVASTPAINFNNTYDKLVIFYNFGNSPTADETYYVDLIEFASSGKALVNFPVIFDDSANVDYTLIDFGGNVATIVNDPLNASNLVMKATKTMGAQVWAGTTIGSSFSNAIPFSQGNTEIKALVYSPDSNIAVRIKVEDQTNAQISVEAEALTTVSNGWDTLTFDFSNHAAGTQAINFASTYDKMSVFFDFGTTGANKDYYIDNIIFAGTITPPPTKAQISLPITWDDSLNVNYTVVDFGGNSSMMTLDPTNSSNSVLKSTKTSGAQVWAGTSLGNNLGSAIPFSAGNTVLSAVVYSPDSNTTIRLKVEDQTDPTISVETEAVTTTANAWETLVFDFAIPATGTATINFGNTYDKISIFYDFGNTGINTDYYLDEVTFGITTGIETLNLTNSLGIFPNPATNKINIDLSEIEGEFTMNIYNQNGQLILSELSNNRSLATIDISTLNSGVYFIQLISDYSTQKAKFIKK